MSDEQPKKEKQARTPGQILARGKDKYLIRIFTGRDSTGKRHYHSETFHGKKKAAQEHLRTLLTKLKTGQPLRQTKDSFSTFLDEWLQATKPTVSEASLEHYAEALEYWVRPKLGRIQLTQLEAADIQALYTQLAEAGLAASTIGFVHTLLTSAFKLAALRRKIAHNPMVGVTTPNKGKKKREPVAMEPEQVAQFLAAAEGSRLGALFILAFHTGCRPGELLGLKWGDLNAAKRTLRIQRTIVWRKGGDWYLKDPKTALSRRALPLTTNLVELLAQQRTRQLEERMRAGKAWSDHGFIFANEVGEPYAQWNLRYQCKEILKAAGLPLHFNPYSTRHTTATLLIGGGTNPKIVQERLGHAKVAITLQTYTHVMPGMQEEASEEIERLLSGKK
jgi:integrase